MQPSYFGLPSLQNYEPNKLLFMYVKKKKDKNISSHTYIAAKNLATTQIGDLLPCI
jgi:hypothetical protein